MSSPEQLTTAVLAATDPLHGPQEGAMAAALELLRSGALAQGTADEMVRRDEIFFEAVNIPHPAAVANAVQLIHLLAEAGDTLSEAAAHSALYNCPPPVQEALRTLPLTAH